MYLCKQRRNFCEMKIYSVISLLLPLLNLSSGYAEPIKSATKKVTVRTVDGCSMDASFDGGKYNAKQIENSYRLVLATPSLDHDMYDAELEDLEFPPILKAAKERLRKQSKVTHEIIWAAKTRPDKPLTSIAGYNLGRSCNQYVRDNKQQSDCLNEIDKMFPYEERYKAFKMVILKESTPYNCEP